MFTVKRTGDETRVLTYKDDNCVACGICTNVCPTTSLRLGPVVPIARGLIEMDYLSINSNTCVLCGLCSIACPFDSLSLTLDGEEIKELEKDNKHLEELVNHFKDLFDRLIDFIKHKILGKDREREDYWEFSKDLYEHGIFSDKTITDIKDDYDWNKENDKHKDHDDFDLEI